MTIRRATADDIPTMVMLGQHFIDSTPYGEQIPRDPGHIGSVLNTVLVSGAIFVADSGDGPVGMVAGVVYRHYITGVQTLGESWWWVEPAHRGGTLAPDLLQALEDWGRAQGARVSQIGSRHAILDRYYRRRGYHAVERVHEKEL